jgi:hypothetical protein
MGGFYRVPADKRDLNYDKYFVEGDQKLLLKMSTTLIIQKDLILSRLKKNYYNLIMWRTIGKLG